VTYLDSRLPREPVGLQSGACLNINTDRNVFSNTFSCPVSCFVGCVLYCTAFRTALSSHGGRFSSFNIFCFTNCIKSGCHFFTYTCATRPKRYDTDSRMESPGVTAVIEYNVFLDVIKIMFSYFPTLPENVYGFLGPVRNWHYVIWHMSNQTKQYPR